MSMISDVAILAPQEIGDFLDQAIAAGRTRKPAASLAGPYNEALDRAQVAVAKVRVWAARQTSGSLQPTARHAPLASMGIPAFASGVRRIRAVAESGQTAEVPASKPAQTVDAYAAGLDEAFSALAEAGALLARSAAAQPAEPQG